MSDVRALDKDLPRHLGRNVSWHATSLWDVRIGDKVVLAQKNYGPTIARIERVSPTSVYAACRWFDRATGRTCEATTGEADRLWVCTASPSHSRAAVERARRTIAGTDWAAVSDGQALEVSRVLQASASRQMETP